MTKHEKDVLLRVRAVLITALHDTPEDLSKPERSNVLNQRIEEISKILERSKLVDSSGSRSPRRHGRE